MFTVIICLLIAVLLPIILALSTAPVRLKQEGFVDTKTPRVQAAKLQGIGQRLVFAQANAWEALAVFLAALFAANMTGVDISTIMMMAQIFIIARICHAIFYIADLSPFRSLSFLIGLGSCIWLFVAALKI
ncbi:MAPEG family protein [Gammaproteobacteria bacterium]|nr:MAPEG family protein [Gammaproteobacteria bacterium]